MGCMDRIKPKIPSMRKPVRDATHILSHNKDDYALLGYL
jgi:hypothetical protein